MLERLAAWFLNTYVAEYVGNLNTDQLNIGLFSGAIVFDNLVLKKDALDKLKLPIEVKAGYLGRLKLQMPMRYFNDRKWLIEIDRLYLVAGPPNLNKFDPDEEKESAQLKKEGKLSAMEQKWREEQQGGSSSLWSSLASSFTSSIADGLQVTFNNIHIRYEDSEVGGASDPLVVGLIIDELTSRATNEKWEEVEFSSGGRKSFKLISLVNLGVYWDHELLGDLDKDEFMDSMQKKALTVKATRDMMSSSYYAPTDPEANSHSLSHILLPLEAKAMITLNRSADPLKISDGPRVSVDAQLSDGSIVLSQDQVNKFVGLSDAFKLRMISQRYRHLRPRVTIKQSPGAWWMFAIESVSEVIRENQKRLSLDFILRRARQSVLYVSAYTSHLTQSVISEDTKRILEENEIELNYEELVILRRVAMHRIEKERALAEEAKRVGATEGRGNWLSNWWTGGREGGEEGTDSDTTNSESMTSNEEKILDELGLEMDGNSKLLRDRIFAQLSFTLIKGSLQLVIEEGGVLGPHPLLELELSSLSSKIDYRPRLKYSSVEVFLKELNVFDHYHEDTHFPTLVQPKKSNSSPLVDVFHVQLVSQEIESVKRHNLSLTTSPLDVVYNRLTVNRLKSFFSSSSSSSSVYDTEKIGSVVGGVDHTLLDNVLVKLDISAPHLLIPKDVTQANSTMVVVNLGHMTFESVSDWSFDSERIEPEEDDLDIDDDDEFVTPPSTPPLLSESSQSLTQTQVEEAINKKPQPSVIKNRPCKVQGYVLKLSEIQVLVGEFDKIQSEISSGQSLLHLLNQFNATAQIERVKRDGAQFNVTVDLPLIHLHIDETKVHTLLTCLIPPTNIDTDTDTDTDTDHTTAASNEGIKSMYYSLDHVSPHSSLSLYQSTFNFMGSSRESESCDSTADDHVTDATGKVKHLSTEYASQQLIKIQVNINEVNLDLNANGVRLVELKILSVRAGAIQRPYDTTVRLLVEECVIVDTKQDYGPQYELIFCSNGQKLFTDTGPRKIEGDVFEYCPSSDGLIFMSLLVLSPLSPDHPTVLLPGGEGGAYTAYTDQNIVRKCNVHCTPVDIVANQKTIVELITFSKKCLPPHVSKGNSATPNPKTPSTTSHQKTTPTQTDLSLELDKISIRTLRGSPDNKRDDNRDDGDEGETSLFTSSYELTGLGVDLSFGRKEERVSGYLEGVRITDLTPAGRKHPLIVSLGAWREGRDQDMITTMMTSFDSLKKMADCLQFSISRNEREGEEGEIDISVFVHVPSIVYTHSVNFIYHMNLFALDFMQYFNKLSDSMKTAALGVAKGLVREKSQLASRLSQLSTSLGGRKLTTPTDEDETDMGGVSDRVLVDVKIESPVVVLPSPASGQDCLIAHLGQIGIKNEFIDIDEETVLQDHSHDTDTNNITDFNLSSSLVDRLTLHVSNVSLHSSHDIPSRDYLVSESTAVRGGCGLIPGSSYRILPETSLLFVIERAVGGCGQYDNESLVDVKVTCTCSSKSIFLSLPNSVFTQMKLTASKGLFKPVLMESSFDDSASDAPPTAPPTPSPAESLPKIYCSFSLPRLSIELKHLIGAVQKDIVFVSFDDFVARCRKTTPHHTHFDLALKSIIIEDLLQEDDSYRYILSSTLKPLPFSSPVTNSSLHSHTPYSHTASLGISPRSFLPLSQLISSPKPPRVDYSPLRSFNPLVPVGKLTTPTNGSATPPADSSISSSVTDVQDAVSISGIYVSEDDPSFMTSYNGVSLHVNVLFSSVYLVVNLQTWVLLFDYLGIGVPTPPSSPSEDTPTATNLDELEQYSLKYDGSVYIKPVSKSSLLKERSSTVWGTDGKLSADVSLRVQSLSLTLNKQEHPLARGTATELSADVNVSQGNLSVKGSLGTATLIDLTETGSYYRERLTTTGQQALSFDVFKFGRKDPLLERPYDISANVSIAAIRYLHTMRFLKETISFLQHFPQLIDAFQRMKALSRGQLSYAPDRKPRILLEVEANGPMILIPKHAFSPEIMGGVINHLTLSNKFLYDGDVGTLSHSRRRGQVSPLIPRVQSTPASLSSSPGRGWLIHDHTHRASRTDDDKEVIEGLLYNQGPVLLDVMGLLLDNVDVFSASKKPLPHTNNIQDGYHYSIERDKGKCLKERGTLRLIIERNLYEDFCRSVPDIHIDAKLSAVHLMLDKRQLEIIKGLIDMNLGEHIEEFEKPSSVILDPVAQPIVAAVWTGFRFHIQFVEVQLEFLQSRGPDDFNHSLALFDILLSEFTFESHSDQSKTVDFTTHSVIGHDTRYNYTNVSDSVEKPNVFEEVLKPRYTSKDKKSLQVEIHVTLSPRAIKASILLNRLRLIGIIDLLIELKQFVIDKIPEVDEDEYDQSVLEEVDGEEDNSLLQIKLKSLPPPKEDEEKKPDRDVKVGLSITETDLVVVEDLTSLTSNAVVMKGTVVLNFHSPPTIRGPSTLHCSVDGLELFSCCVSQEDDTALSILDPVSIGVELKPLDTPSKDGGTHTLEFDVRQLNVRLSYNDIKLFVAILQNLQASASSSSSGRTEQVPRLSDVNEKLVKRLLPLGFTRTAILKELNKGGDDVNVVALQLLEEERKELEKKDQTKQKMKLRSLEVLMGSLNIYLIDDSLNHDIPLIEFSLSSLQASNQIASGMEGHAKASLSLDYYNRNISSWEPIIEPWKVSLNWKKIVHFSTDLDTNEKPDRINFSLSSPNTLNVNITSSFLLLVKDTKASWSSDISDTREDIKMTSATRNDQTKVQQGLALLHSVRFISQSRQRTKFIPFSLVNSTGLTLKFATLTSLPSHVLFSASALLQSPRSSLLVESKRATPTEWVEVAPSQEKLFDFVSRQKIRHKDTRELILHQLRVEVKGYEEINIPISVDKIGLFFRDVLPCSGRGTESRLYFAVSLRETRKCINIRSGLVIHNMLELPMEIKLDPPKNEKGSSVGLPVVPSGGLSAVPIHLTNWFIRVRPQGWGLKFCTHPLEWEKASYRAASTELRSCDPLSADIANKTHPFRFCVEVSKDTASSTPNHTICLRSVFTVTNLLPYGFHFSFKSKEKHIPSGQEVAIHNVNSLRPVTFSISKLESFEFSDNCTVSITEVGVVKPLIVHDKANRSLNLHVNTEQMSKGSLKVVIWCPYWLINRTSLPLVFTSQGDSSGGKCAGQFEEHETATSMSPLLFSYSEDDLLQKCQVRLGRGQDEGVPSWSTGFRMLRDEDVLRLFVKRGQGRPDKEYQIGMEVKKGTGVYKPTKVVTFVARFQLENRTTFNLKYLQRHLVFAKDESSDSVPVIAPGAMIAFHWPRADLDQLLCIRVVELSDCHWSGGFPLEQDKSFHINMRCSYGRSVFIRCEVILRGATYHVIFSDASDYPPPFKLENLSQITVICYQQSVTSQQQYTVLNPGQSVPYAWDEVTLPEKLCLHIKDVSEPRPFDLSSFGPQGKVYYESYFYIVAMDTKTDQSHLPESHRLEGELVLDVPQGRAVLLTRKGLERRTQLWRMTASGQLVHISSSSSKSANFVLDLAGSVPPNYRHSNRPLPLVISRANERRSSTQSWEFKNGRLVLSSYPHLCVQVRHGYEGKVDGMDAVVGCVGSGDKEEFRRLKKSPGSGVLSVSLVPDGPTRVLRITDESKKYTKSGATDDWIIVEHGLIAPAVSSSIVELTNEENDIKTELSVSFTLEKGVSVSLINSTPEELLLATVTGVRVEFVSTAVHQCINATIQYIQVDNQMHNGFHQIVLFPTPPPSGELDTNFPVISCFIERLPHNSPLATVFRTFDVKIKQFTVLLEEKLLFRLIQWSGYGIRSNDKDADTIKSLLIPKRHWGSSSVLPSRQIYIEQLRISTSELLVSMHTTSQLPEDLAAIKKSLGFPLVQFESPIILEGFNKSHMLGRPVVFVDSITKHYKKVMKGQAVMILGSVDFLGNPVGLISDVASGLHGIMTAQPDVVGLVRDVTHGMSDTTSKLTGTVSHVLGTATGDSSFQEEREQNLESCQTSGDHFKAGLINLTSGIFGGMTSILTQPYKGAVEEGVGGFIWGIGKGVVGTVAKPVAGLLDFASGTTAALRETMSRVSRQMPQPIRLRRACTGASGSGLIVYSIQLARGQEYLLSLNDGNIQEKLIAYERFNNGSVSNEMRVIISSQNLYFFETSPPDLSSLDSLIKLEQLAECRATTAKITIPTVLLVLSVREKEEGGGEGSIITTKKYKCMNESNARKIAQLINYAKNLHDEEKMVIKTPRLQNQTIW